MRKFILMTVAIFAVLFSAKAQENNGVKWEKSSFAEVLKMAKNDTQGRNLVFLDCYASWCGPCKYMASKVFTTEQAGKYFNSKFINMKLDMEKGEGRDVAKTYNVRVYPTFLILNPEGEVLARIEGGNEIDAFIQTVEKHLEKISNR